MHRWCLHGTINSYHNFWSNLILCLYNKETLNICTKEFGSETNIFYKTTAVRTFLRTVRIFSLKDNFFLIGLLYMHRWCLHGPINSYHSFEWSNLILCLYNKDTLNICMKEFGLEIFFDKLTAMRT